MTSGRPKAKVERTVQINLRFTKSEADEISKIAEKLKITKTDAILRGIELLKNSAEISQKVQVKTIFPKNQQNFEKTFNKPKISKKTAKKKFPKPKNLLPDNDDDNEFVFFKDMKYEDIPKNLRKQFEYKKYE